MNPETTITKPDYGRPHQHENKKIEIDGIELLIAQHEENGIMANYAKDGTEHIIEI